jgi:hypothetical protein
MPQPQMGQPQMGQPQMPQPQGRMPAGRMPAASGGIMDMFNKPNMADIAGSSGKQQMESKVADLMKDLQRTDLTDLERAMAQEKLKAYGSQEQVDSLFSNQQYAEALIDQLSQQGLSPEEIKQEYIRIYSESMEDSMLRENKAYGGIMGDDGRKQYGIGSWFQEKIMDPIKNNPKTSALIGGALLNQFGLPDNIGLGKDTGKNWFGNIFNRDAVIGAGGEGTKVLDGGGGERKGLFEDIMQSSTNDGKGTKTPFGLSPGMLSTIGGGVAGLFSDKLNPPDEEGNIDYGSSIGIQNVGKAANILDPKQAMAAGLRFSPELSTRKYSPAEMLASYGGVENEPLATANLASGGISQLGIPDYEQQMMDPNMMEQIRMMVEGMQAQGMGREAMEEAVRMQVPDMSADMSMGYAEGGPSGEMGTVMEEGEEMLDLGGMEKDYREEGGFVPIGEYEKKDDVPARLSVNEFVFTADAVRGAGDGDIDKGAERLQGIMKQLEQQGRPEGMEMLDVSERLSEVV